MSVIFPSQTQRRSVPLHTYSPLSESDASQEDNSSSSSRPRNIHPKPKRSSAPTSGKMSLARPSLSRFLADFTLGFADGLTVPFALTAGLSSLGRTETVIYAGMAEICAGSLSMGIGGYLAAKGEQTAGRTGRDLDEDVTEPTKAKDVEKGDDGYSRVVEEYLACLDLPASLRKMVVAHVNARCDVLEAIDVREGDKGDMEDRQCSPLFTGLSVALGYLLGGLLPLFPYFVVTQVGDGFYWSLIVGMISFFMFGFTKDFVINRESEGEGWVRRSGSRVIPWADIRRSAWEGTQMVILGGVAAAAAVLCIKSFSSTSDESEGVIVSARSMFA